MTSSIQPRSIPAVRQLEYPRDYSAFGGVLRSEIEFPELPPAHGHEEPNWALVVRHTPPVERERAFLGERRIREERYRLWRMRDRFRLTYSHAGTFDILDHGAQIVWYADIDSLGELVRNIVLGPAMALALELAGHLCLHASAVSIQDRAVVFLGPKHFGKSTLAAALTAAGGQLLADDLLAVDPRQPVLVRPGVPTVRLWPDIARAVSLDGVASARISGLKMTVAGFSVDARAVRPATLGSVYVLSPLAKDTAGPPATRERLHPATAAAALAQQTKLPDSLVGLQLAASRLATAAAVAAAVPVWTLRAVRDLAKLDAVVGQILDWSRLT